MRFSSGSPILPQVNRAGCLPDVAPTQAEGLVPFEEGSMTVARSRVSVFLESIFGSHAGARRVSLPATRSEPSAARVRLGSPAVLFARWDRVGLAAVLLLSA